MRRDKKLWYIVGFATLGLILSFAVPLTIISKNLNKETDNKPKQEQLEEINIEDIEFKRNEAEEKEVEEIKKNPTYTTFYATTYLNIRTDSTTNSKVYATVRPNSKLRIEDDVTIHDIWKRVLYDNKTLYVHKRYLSKNPVKVKTERKVSSSNLIGKFKITHYAGDTMTSTGAVPTVGRTIAVDPRVIPYGSRVVINGHTYIAEDCGGAVKGNVIDIFVSSRDEAYQKGVYYTNVYWG